MTYENILVAVDMTDEAEDVIKAAREIAQEDNPTISAVTVIRPMAEFYINLYSTLEGSEEIDADSRAVKNATAWLSRVVRRCNIDASGVNVIVGTPAVEIHQLAERIDADLIVIGAHGRHGLGLTLGSTANGIINRAPCDVLAVKVHNQVSE